MTYIGYYRTDPDYARHLGQLAREAGHAVTEDSFREKVAGLRDKLPPTIKLLGSYAPIRSGTSEPDLRHPSVWICECDDPAELGFVNNYYAGYLQFEWVPAIAVGTTSTQTDATMRHTAARGT